VTRRGASKRRRDRTPAAARSERNSRRSRGRTNQTTMSEKLRGCDRHASSLADVWGSLFSAVPRCGPCGRRRRAQRGGRRTLLGASKSRRAGVEACFVLLGSVEELALISPRGLRRTVTVEGGADRDHSAGRPSRPFEWRGGGVGGSASTTRPPPEVPAYGPGTPRPLPDPGRDASEPPSSFDLPSQRSVTQ